MSEPHQTRELVGTLHDALHQLASTLARTREGVDGIAAQGERLQAGVVALSDLHQQEVSAVGIDMLVDAAVELLAAFRELESGLLDAQADVDTLEAGMADNEEGRAG